VGGNTAEIQLAGHVGSRECVRERRAERRVPVALKRKNSADDGIQRFGRIRSAGVGNGETCAVKGF